MKETLLQSSTFECFISTLFENVYMHSPRVPARMFPHFAGIYLAENVWIFAFILATVSQLETMKEVKRLFNFPALFFFFADIWENETRYCVAAHYGRQSDYLTTKHLRTLACTQCASANPMIFQRISTWHSDGTVWEDDHRNLFSSFSPKKISFLLAKCSIKNYSNNFVRLVNERKNEKVK